MLNAIAISTFGLQPNPVNLFLLPYRLRVLLQITQLLFSGRLGFELKFDTSFPGGSVVKNALANAGDVGLIPGSGRSPGEGNGNPLQYSCLGNPMDRGAGRATVQGAARVKHDLASKPRPPHFCCNSC